MSPITQSGEALYIARKNELEFRHPDQYVLIDVNGGKFVAAPAWLAAIGKFENAYGKVPGYLRRIGDFEYAGNIGL